MCMIFPFSIVRATDEVEPLAYGEIIVSIYSSVNTLNSLSSSTMTRQHAWIVITNYGSAKKIGNYNVPYNGSVTIGTWGNTTPKGLWYNKERNRISDFQNNNNTVYLQTTMYESQISSINNVINNGNSWNLLTNNCTHFAIRIWNAAGGTFIPNIHTPMSLREKIMTYYGYKTGTNDAGFRAASSNARAH